MKLLHYDTLHPCKIGDLRAKVIIGVCQKKRQLVSRSHASGSSIRSHKCRFGEVFSSVLLGTILPLCAG